MKRNRFFSYAIALLCLTCFITGCNHEVKTCVVTFNNHGEMVKQVVVNEGGTISENDIPKLSEEGMTFEGWFLGDEKYSFKEQIKNNVTLEAKWSDIYFSVTFDSQGGSAVEAVEVKYGETITLPDAPTREGFKFEGWKHSDGSDFESSVKVYEDITLTAKWNHNEHVFNESNICRVCNGVKCGDNAIFFYDEETKTITLDGSGSTYDYLDGENFSERPWENYLEEVTSVIIGEGITRLGDASFALLDDKGFVTTSINKILFPTTIKEIGAYSFAGASFENIVIPEGTLELGAGAFAMCKKLTEITIPASIETFGYDVFDESDNLSKVIFLGNEEQWSKYDLNIEVADHDVYLKNEDRYLIFNFYYKGDVLTADYLTKHGNELEELVVPEYIEGINGSIFKKSKAKKLYIPGSVITIEGDTFSNASNLKEVYVDMTEEEFRKVFTDTIDTSSIKVTYKEET